MILIKDDEWADTIDEAIEKYNNLSCGDMQACDDDFILRKGLLLQRFAIVSSKLRYILESQHKSEGWIICGRLRDRDKVTKTVHSN